MVILVGGVVVANAIQNIGSVIQTLSAKTIQTKHWAATCSMTQAAIHGKANDTSNVQTVLIAASKTLKQIVQMRQTRT